jgi:hypothetical protein
MHDPILEKIWRVRAQVIKDHGGVDGYLRYIEMLDAEDRRRQRNRRIAEAAGRRKVRTQAMANKPSLSQRAPIPRDPILDEIHRVRRELLKKHGGWKGYDRYLQKLDSEHRRLELRRKLAAKARRAKLKKNQRQIKQ